MREIRVKAFTSDNVMHPPKRIRDINFLDCSKDTIFLEETGLWDKNGKSIYCDDILKYKQPIFSKGISPNLRIIGSEYVYAKICKVAGGFTFLREVFWNDSFLAECGDAIADIQTRSWIEDNCIIAGNIYENKELLDER